MRSITNLLPATLPLWLVGLLSAQGVVFQCDFDGPLPPEVNPGSPLLTGVQGYAGLGPVGKQFANAFLRSATGNTVTIQLTGLPPHDAIELDFLFAAIDSLDGTGTFPGGDFFAIEIDGNLFFRESFANALPTQIQSYVAPPGVTLARRVDLGFSGPGSYFTDSAYWLGGGPLFQAIGHSASTLTIRMQIEGPGIQPLQDESWAIDNLTIRALQLGNPGSIITYGATCGPVLSGFGVPRIGTTLSAFVGNLPGTTVLAGLAFGLDDGCRFRRRSTSSARLAASRTMTRPSASARRCSCSCQRRPLRRRSRTCRPPSASPASCKPGPLCRASIPSGC